MSILIRSASALALGLAIHGAGAAATDGAAKSHTARAEPGKADPAKAEPAKAEKAKSDLAKAHANRSKPLQRCDQLADKAQLDCLGKARERVVEARKKREAASGKGPASAAPEAGSETSAGSGPGAQKAK